MAKFSGIKICDFGDFGNRHLTELSWVLQLAASGFGQASAFSTSVRYLPPLAPSCSSTVKDKVQYSAVFLLTVTASAKIILHCYMDKFAAFNFMRTAQSTSSSQGSSNGNFTKDEDMDILVPPVPFLLDSNDPPYEEERRRINEILVIAKQRLAKLHSRMVGDGVHRKDKEPGIGRGQLEKHFSRTQTFIQKHESITSCVRYLPVELLQLIFIQCLPTLNHCDWNRQPWNNGPIFALSQVCARWRQIAHDTPQLWSVVGKIQLNRETAKKGHNTAFYFVSEFLKRSRGQGLWLDISAHFTEYRTPEAHPLIELILQHADRWEVMTIASTWPTITSFLYRNSTTHSPSSSSNQPFFRLRRLGIEIWKQSSGFNKIIEFKGAPSLEDLFVSGHPPADFALPVVGLQKYRECRFGNTENSHLADVLKRSQGVQRLELIDFVYFNNTVLSSSIRLDSLTVFHLKLRRDIRGSWISLESLFDALILPSFSELKVAGCPGPQLVSKLTLLLLRSHCVLRTLCISTSDAFPRDLDRLLELTPKLEELDVDVPSMMDMFVLGVGNNPSRSSGTIVPNLKRLTFRFTPKTDSIERCTSSLSLIARSRFNGPPTTTEDDSVVAVDPGAEVCPTTRSCFRLVFRSPDKAHAAQIHLYSCAKIQNASPDWGNDDEGCLNSLVFWRLRLHDELPELDGKPAPGKRRLDLGFSHRLNKLFMEIEVFEPLCVLGLSSLLTSKLHHSLHRLTLFRPGYILGDNTFNFRNHSLAVLKKWEKYIKNDMANLEWALIGRKSLVFFPDSDPLRENRKIFDMIYGMDGAPPEVDVDWMDNM